MRRAFLVLPFLLAAAAATMAAMEAADFVEAESRTEVTRALNVEGLGFADVSTDGLLVTLTGTAPSEAMRFRALSTAGKIVDPARILDALEVADAHSAPAPRFGLEILRNEDGLSLIGLVPEGTDRGALAAGLEDATDAPVSDFMEIADYAPPAGWEAALGFAIDAVARLDRVKLSVDGERVLIATAATSPEEKARIEEELRAAAPEGLRLVLSVTAPRPVIAPFTLRFVKDSGQVRFDACSAGSASEAARLRAAARAAGATGPDCRIGLGSPSPRWGDAGAASIEAISRLPEGGEVTLTDADVSFIASSATPGPLFEEVAGALREALPPEFALAATLPDPEDEGPGTPAEVVVTLSPEGDVQIRGALPDDRARSTVGAFARSRFGSEAVYLATAERGDLPGEWTTRVLTGLEALSRLDSGALVLDAGGVSLRGVTGRKGGKDEIAGMLAARLGEGQSVALDVAYDEALDPEMALPTPEECLERINGANLARKITFAPGSDRIEPAGLRTVGEIATILRDCQGLRIEVAAYCDSQGREEMNLRLSQSRAQAVIDALASRRAFVIGLEAKGYGEADPIADNGTAEGREANRRIEFRLISAESAEGGETE